MKLRIWWFIRHPIQAKYLLTVLFAMLAPILLIGFCFYNLVFNLLARQMVFPEAIMANLVPVIERVNSLLIVLLPILILTMSCIALAMSHRFAGPIERLEAELDHILVGEYRKIHLRKNDDLIGIAARINTLVDRLKK